MNKIKAYGVCVYKKYKNSYKILLCKSVLSYEKWGFLKGGEYENETKKQTAIREFTEESSIPIKESMLEEYFFQKNNDKDIGIYLINAVNIKNLDKYFFDCTLNSRYLSLENSKVKFFDIDKLPKIKKKQIYIMQNILENLHEKSSI